MGWANSAMKATAVSTAGRSASARAFGVACSGPASCGAMRRTAVYTAPVRVVVVAPASITVVLAEGHLGKDSSLPPHVPSATHAIHRGNHDGPLHRHPPRDLVAEPATHPRHEAERHAGHCRAEQELAAKRC